MDVSSILSAPPRIFSLSERPLRLSRRFSVPSASSRWGLSLARSLFRSVPGSSDIPSRTLVKAPLGSHSWWSHLWSRCRQPGHLLQRSVSFAPPPRGEFALFDHIQAL